MEQISFMIFNLFEGCIHFKGSGAHIVYEGPEGE